MNNQDRVFVAALVRKGVECRDHRDRLLQLLRDIHAAANPPFFEDDPAPVRLPPDLEARILKEIGKLNLNKMAKLTDDSPMPYGKHKGKSMQDVPADYLLWLFENDKCGWDVAVYVRDNFDVLEKQRKEEKQKSWNEKTA